jgi:hypothetical protein
METAQFAFTGIVEFILFVVQNIRNVMVCVFDAARSTNPSTAFDFRERRSAKVEEYERLLPKGTSFTEINEVWSLVQKGANKYML